MPHSSLFSWRQIDRICSYFCQKIGLTFHQVQIVPWEDNLHEMSKPVFCQKNKKSISKYLLNYLCSIQSVMHWVPGVLCCSTQENGPYDIYKPCRPTRWDWTLAQSKKTKTTKTKTFIDCLLEITELNWERSSLFAYGLTPFESWIICFVYNFACHFVEFTPYWKPQRM